MVFYLKLTQLSLCLLTGSMIIFVQECTIFEGTNYDSTVIFILPGAMQYNVSIQKSFSKISSISQGYSVQKNCVSVYVTMYSYGDEYGTLTR